MMQKILFIHIFGTGSEYFLEEVGKISDVPSKDTAELLTYNLPMMTENEDYKVIGWKFDWSQLYGELSKRKIYIFIACFWNTIT